METKDIILIILAIITIFLTVPGAIKAIDDLLHPQNTIQPLSSNSFNGSSNDGIIINDNSKGSNYNNTIYNINKPTPTTTPIATFTPIKLPNYTNSIGMEFLKIPAGTFVMGDKASNITYNDNGQITYSERPEHTVKIENTFYLGKNDVTCKQWTDIMGSKTYAYCKGDDYPVVNVTWDDVQTFITKLNEKEGSNKYRLPSEAEWEYACRANTTTEYYFGNDESMLDEYAWYDRNSMNDIHPVGQKKPNPWGLSDMLGNVCEMTQDQWHDSYDQYFDGYPPSDGSSWGSYNTSDSYSQKCGFVIRGGLFSAPATYCRSASRYSFSPDDVYMLTGYTIIGFRLVMDTTSHSVLTSVSKSTTTSTLTSIPASLPKATPKITPTKVQVDDIATDLSTDENATDASVGENI